MTSIEQIAKYLRIRWVDPVTKLFSARMSNSSEFNVGSKVRVFYRGVSRDVRSTDRQESSAYSKRICVFHVSVRAAELNDLHSFAVRR
jgi:hypothetical protein